MKALHQPVELKITRLNVVDYLELMIRIITGIFLVLDGVYVLRHSAQLEVLFSKVMSYSMVDFIIVFIGVVQLFGGTFIVLGLLTRIVIVLQIPAILAKIYYIQPANSFLGSWEIIGSAILLILLVFLFVINSGKFSMDYYRKRKQL